jgi:phosphohistidine phosphatase
MHLVIVRHAIAEDREEFAKTGQPDSERPLTKRGRAVMARVAKGLARQVKSIDVLAASPLVRAAQTAAIIAKEYDGMSVRTVPALEPDREPEALKTWLDAQRNVNVVAVVGHEPHLGMLITWLISGLRDSHVTLDKGGACMLEIEGKAEARGATLTWSLPPDVLAALSKD